VARTKTTINGPKGHGVTKTKTTVKGPKGGKVTKTKVRKTLIISTGSETEKISL
jgi:hypothetical protein